MILCSLSHLLREDDLFSKPGCQTINIQIKIMLLMSQILVDLDFCVPPGGPLIYLVETQTNQMQLFSHVRVYPPPQTLFCYYVFVFEFVCECYVFSAALIPVQKSEWNWAKS